MFTLPDSLVPFIGLAENVAQIGFASTLTFCSILIYLTIFKVDRDFGSYKYMLLLFPVVGILFATIELVLCPNVHSYNAGYIFFAAKRPFGLSKNSTNWLLSLYTGVYAATISMLSSQFVYRYWAIFSEYKLRFFQGWRFIFCIMYSSFFGLYWTLGNHYFMKIDDYGRSYMENEMMSRYKINISETPGMILVAYDELGGTRWWNVQCTMNSTFIMLVQYSLISYCTYFMYKGMEEKLQLLSVPLKNLHKQFFKTLLLQIFTPLVTLFSPVTFIMYLPLFDIKMSLPTGVFLCAFTLYPAMDAIIVLYVVQDYRRAVKKMSVEIMDSFKKWFKFGRVEDSYSVRTQSAATNVHKFQTDVLTEIFHFQNNI